MAFKASVQGIKIHGNIEVTDDALRFDAKVPLIAVPFKSWIPNILQNVLKEQKSKIQQSVANNEKPILLYLHIPKTGGTTLANFIYNHCQNESGESDGLVKNAVFFTSEGFFRENEIGFSSHNKAVLERDDLAAVTGHFSFGIHQLLTRPYEYITILRDPVQRVISLYSYLKLEDKMSLKDFALHAPYLEVDNDQTRRIAGISHSQKVCTEKDLLTAKYNLKNMFSVVGITERLDEVMALLTLHFNWTKSIGSFPRNVNPDKKDTVLFDAETVDAVLKRNMYDLELYNYANQLMDEKIAVFNGDFPAALNAQFELNKS